MNENFTRKIQQEISRHYGFENVSLICEIGGLSALNCMIKADSQALVFKKYSSTDFKDIEKIENVSLFLHENGLPVALPIKTDEDLLHFKVDEQFFAVYPKIAGNILHEPSLSETALHSAALIAARFHELGACCLLNLEPLNLLSVAEIYQKTLQIRNLINKHSLGKDIDKLAEDLLDAKLNFLDRLVSPAVCKKHLFFHDLIHGDFHNENLLFNEAKQIVGILDFEEVCFGPGIEDLMSFIQFGCCNTGFELNNMKKARFFFQSYLEKHPLSKEEIYYGINYSLYRFAGNFFLENKLYETRDKFFSDLLLRNLNKIIYFTKNLKAFINYLSV